MNERPKMLKQDPWQDTRYTGNAQHFPRHELEGEGQATIGEWSDAMLAQGRDVLTDGTLSSDDPVTLFIAGLVSYHRQAKDFQRQVNMRMAQFRQDNPERHQVEQERGE